MAPLIHEFTCALVVLGPEHAHVFASAGWSKDNLRQYIYRHAVRTRAELAAVGKDAISRRTRWRLPADHPDAVPDQASTGADPDRVPVLRSPSGVQIIVAGANNAGVSAVLDVFYTPREIPLSIAALPG